MALFFSDYGINIEKKDFPEGMSMAKFNESTKSDWLSGLKIGAYPTRSTVKWVDGKRYALEKAYYGFVGKNGESTGSFQDYMDGIESASKYSPIGEKKTFEEFMASTTNSAVKDTLSVDFYPEERNTFIASNFFNGVKECVKKISPDDARSGLDAIRFIMNYGEYFPVWFHWVEAEKNHGYLSVHFTESSYLMAVKKDRENKAEEEQIAKSLEEAINLENTMRDSFSEMMFGGADNV